MNKPSTPRKKYGRAIGPKLRRLLLVVFVLIALLVANSAYLGSVTLLEWGTGNTYQNYFYLSMFLVHLAVGLVLTIPFLVFSIVHMRNTWRRRNRRAVRAGYGLFVASLVVIASGIALLRIGSFDLKSPPVRAVVYWAHIIAPFAAIWLYWLHRLAGPRIKWRLGGAYAVAVGVATVLMIAFHSSDPRKWNVAGPPEGEKYFFPSLSRTATGDFIPANIMMMDEYCKECHEKVHGSWIASAHHFSSFNNPAYLATIRVTRKKLLARDGSVQGARFCAGCHDPVPFFSGAFDDPDYDDIDDPTARAGITCTACHAITHVNSPKGNGDFTIEQPQHYPFTFSENPVLNYLGRQLVKAKPSLHKKTFLKPLHQTAEFCGACHKVHLPKELNAYKFLRGQNHYDSYLLSGVSGHGARSFYYPEEPETNCNRCHMPLKEADEFGADYFDDANALSIHDHLFPSANTAVAVWNHAEDVVAEHKRFNKGVMRVDLFGIREEGTIDGRLHAPLRPNLPTLEPGRRYLLETVIRTVKMGHHFTQGTTDSNEIWLDVIATSGGKVIGKSGGMTPRGEVDPWSHFVNTFLLDRNGNRIAERNAEDIFIALYDHQIPPGAAQTVHYALDLPEYLDGPIEVRVALKYRKFDARYLDFIAASLGPGDPLLGKHPLGPVDRNDLPVMVLAEDRVVFPVGGGDRRVGVAPSRRGPKQTQAASSMVHTYKKTPSPQPSPPESFAAIGFEVEYPMRERFRGRGGKRAVDAATSIEQAGHEAQTPDVPAWIRWNDYGIGLLLSGKAQLRQAAEAFGEVEKFGRYDGPLNLARVYFDEGRIDEAADALERAAKHDSPAAPPWTVAWFSGIINRQQGRLEAAEENLRAIVENRLVDEDQRRSGFDFSKDYVAINKLGETRFDRAKQASGHQRQELLLSAAEAFQKTLQLDPENVTAHHNLHLIYRQLGDAEKAKRHAALHSAYRIDDNARDQAIAAARKRYPAANHAAEATVIYSLNREGAP